MVSFNAEFCGLSIGYRLGGRRMFADAGLNFVRILSTLRGTRPQKLQGSRRRSPWGSLVFSPFGIDVSTNWAGPAKRVFFQL